MCENSLEGNDKKPLLPLDLSVESRKLVAWQASQTIMFLFVLEFSSEAVFLPQPPSTPPLTLSMFLSGYSPVSLINEDQWKRSPSLIWKVSPDGLESRSNQLGIALLGEGLAHCLWSSLKLSF